MAVPALEWRIADWQADRELLARVRREVFVVEQGIPEREEWDDEDPVSRHVLATLNRDPVGTGRLNPAGKIGRIAVVARLRGRGVGSEILRRLLEEARRAGIPRPWLHAQLQAVSFYEKRGFGTEGGVFDEAGIPHVRMRLAAK